MSDMEKLLQAMDKGGREKLAEWTGAFIGKLTLDSQLNSKTLGELEDQVEANLIREIVDSVLWPLQDIIRKKLDDGVSLQEISIFIINTLKELPVLLNAVAEIKNLPEALGTIQDNPAWTELTDWIKTKEVKRMDEKKLRELLGVDEKADIEETIKGLVANQTDQTKLTKDLSTKAAEVTKLTETIANIEKAKKDGIGLREFTDMKDQVKKLSEQLTDAQKEIKLRDRDKAVREAVEGGKLLPVEKEWADGYALSDPKGFGEMVKARPKMVEFDEKGSAASGDADPKKAEAKAQEYVKGGLSLKEAYIKLEKEEPELFKSL